MFKRNKRQAQVTKRRLGRRLACEQLEDRRLLAVYSSGDVDLAIPDQGEVVSTIEIEDSLTIGDLDVTLNIAHNRDQDLDVFLIAPDGTRVELFTDVGGGGDNFSGTTIDDEASTSIDDGSAPFSGSYRPEGTLSVLDGKDSQGTWTLELTDDKRREAGTLNNWSIEVTPSGPVVPTISIDDVTVSEGDTSFRFIDEFIAARTSPSLDQPLGLVVGPDGNIYAGGWASDNVVRFDGTTGAFIDEFVTAGSGGLDSPQGLAFGPDGNLYVSSDLTNEVLHYDGSNGAFLGAFVTSASGGLSGPSGILFGGDVTGDGNEDLYVSSHGLQGVLRYDGISGAFIDQFVASGSGGIQRPEGLAFGPDGNLYVASNETSEVLRYDGTNGTFLDVFVAAGSGGLDRLDGIVFGADSNLYVGSQETDEVLRYDGTTGAFIDAFVPAGQGGLNTPTYLAVDASGDLYVASRRTNEVIRYDGSSGAFVSDSQVVPEDGEIANSRGAEFGPDGNLYVVRSDDPNVQRFNATSGAFIDVFASHDLLTGAKDLEFGPDGNLYVSDNVNDRIVRFDGTTGTFIDVFVASGSGGLLTPRSLVFGTDSNGDGFQDLIVASANSNEVLRYDGVTGAFIDAFVSAGNGGLVSPTALTFGSDGNLYVASGAHQQDNSILRFDGTTGVFIDEFVTAGAAGLTLAPTAGMVFGPDRNNDGNGDLWVSNSEVDEVLVYDGVTGDFLDTAVTAGLGGLDDPKGLVFDNDGNLFVVNNGDDSVRRFGVASQAVFTVTLSAAHDELVNVDFTTSDVSSTAGSDYAAASGTVEFAIGATTATILVATLDDAFEEGNESFAVDLSNATGGATIDDAQGVATIKDDESPDPNTLYVSDISFQSRRGGKQWRAVFEIRSDSNADGTADAADEVREGVQVTVNFAGQTFTGTTDAYGIFRSDWIGGLDGGSHYANVVALVLADYTWDPLGLDLEDDTDGDGKPDDELVI